MSSVRKRVLPSGETRWQVDYRDATGMRRHRQFHRKCDADAYETKVRAELIAGTHVADSASVTVRQAGELWLQRAEQEGLEAGTIRQYRQHLRLHIAPSIGAEKLSRMHTPAVEAFKDTLLKTRSRAMAKAVLTSLKGILKEAQRRGLVGLNVAEPVQISKKRRSRANEENERRTRIEIATKDEIRALLTKSAELWPFAKVERTRKGEDKVVAICWRPMIVTAIFTGMRCSELRGLTWPHVDLEAGVVRVRQRADFQNTMGAPKSEAGCRDIPMAPMVLNTLKAWKLACPSTAQGLVFPTENGRIHSNGNIHKQCWGPLQRAAGVVQQTGIDEDGNPKARPRYSFHSLRHVAASLFIEQGWTPKKVQTVLGHSSIQVTYDTYGHLWEDTERDLEAMAQVEARLLRPSA